jgi:lipid II isoglutaminyl synthase (glutamine-hydrolysing)
MRKLVAIFIGKTIIFVNRKLKVGGGSALPGLIALKIDPNLIKKLTKTIPQGNIVITGTNGKTTTAKYLSQILKLSGYKVISNKSGSNLLRGIASSLIENSSFLGKINADIGLFEIDEATMPQATLSLNPKYVLITNLFRDQLDRYGELDTTAHIIGKSLTHLKGANIILNSDDPLISSLKSFVNDSCHISYFGLEEEKYQAQSNASFDSKDCIACGNELIFSKRYFGHLGDYSCPNCQTKRPSPSYAATNITLNGLKQASVLLTSQNSHLEANLKLSGLYNIYNALSAYSVAKILQIPDQTIKKTLETMSAAFGRMEKIYLDKKEIYLLLIKNPIGFSQVLETLSTDLSAKNFMFCLNDNFADGTDVSWIWDADVEILDKDFKQIICAGIRAEDMALRLKYADMDLDKIIIKREVVEALKDALLPLKDNETLYIMPTYTAMLELRNYLTAQGSASGFWEEEK